MTIKQEQIINAALQLFSEEGYHATSTNKVAKKAKVSEGLIFRHFENKEGLLKAIIKEGEQHTKDLILPILNENDPKEIIRKTLELPFNFETGEHDYWKLQFKLKWELEHDNSETVRPLKLALIKAFTKLRYRSPELESEFLITCLDIVSTAIIKKSIDNESEFKQFLMNKYHL